jgi:hypothetical protein
MSSTETPTVGRSIAAPVAVAVLWFGHLLTRDRDEFVRTLHVSAAAVAFPVSLFAVFAFGLLGEEGLLDWFDARDLVPVMLIAYAAGVTVARRRFQ